MNNNRTAADKSYLRKSIYYVASALMPSIFLFDLYNRNHLQSRIIFLHVLILAGILAIIGVFLFIAFRHIIKSMEGALILAILCWLMFWLYEGLLEAVRDILPIYFFPSRIFALSILLMIIILTFIFKRFKPPFDKVRLVFNTLAFCVIFMFIFNFIPGFSHEINLVRARANLARLHDEKSVYFKKDFNVDQSLPNPDVYWFHLDSVVSLEKMEQFWGLNCDHYREELEARGFIIYEEATLTAGNTEFAWVSLLSPALYDSFLVERLAMVESYLHIGGTGFGPSRAAFLHNQFAQVGLNVREDIHPNLELFRAFFARGYELSVRGLYYTELPTSFEHFNEEYTSGGNMWRDFRRSALPVLLSMTTPLPKVSYEGFDGCSGDVRHMEGIEPVANFVFQLIYSAHMFMAVQYRVIEEDMGGAADDTPSKVRYDLYPYLGFEVAMKQTIEMIDEILERNPNAVIVLQSDHGVHNPSIQRFMLDSGYSEEQIWELMVSVFSAVRIPDVYGGLEEPIAPLNISRELVNQFVGENYELLNFPSRILQTKP